MLSNQVSLFFGKYPADLSAVAEISPVPVAMRPSIGPVAGVNYKRATFAYHVEDGGAAAGEVKLMNGGTLLASGDLAAGSGAIDVDLANVQGQTGLEVLVNVTTAGNAAAAVQCRLDIEHASLSKC